MASKAKIEEEEGKIGNVGPIRTDNRNVVSSGPVAPAYIPGKIEQDAIDRKQILASAPYTRDPAVISARGDDQVLSAYDKRTGGTPAYNGAPTYEKAALDASIGNTDGRMLDILKGMDKDRRPVSTAGTETVLLNNLGQPRGTGTASAGPVTRPAAVNTIPTVVAPAPVIPTVPAQAVRPTAPVIAPTENSIMRETFNALKGRNLDVAGPGHKGNPVDQAIFDAEYKRRANAVNLPDTMTRTRPTVTSARTNVSAPAVTPVRTPVAPIPEVQPAPAQKIADPAVVQPVTVVPTAQPVVEPAAVQPALSYSTPPPIPTSIERRNADLAANKLEVEQSKKTPLWERALKAMGSAGPTGAIARNANNPTDINNQLNALYKQKIDAENARVAAAIKEKNQREALAKVQADEKYKRDQLAKFER